MVTEEKDLVGLAQQGNEQAFEQLLASALVKLKPLLASQYRLQPADVDDIVQESMAKAWKRIHAFRNESAFATWFYIILRNEALDFLKHQQVVNRRETSIHAGPDDRSEESWLRTLGHDTSLEETAASMVEHRELMGFYREMIQKVLDSLAPTHSQIIKLALEEGRSYQEISTTLGIPVGTVMSRLFYARKNAQRLIIQYARQHAIQLNGVGRYE